MPRYSFHLLKEDDKNLIDFIAGCYLEAWNVPIDKTSARLKQIITDADQFQLVMLVDEHPVATGGLYTHVSLQDHVPHFKDLKYWLGMVYTAKPARHKGYGASICLEIERIAAEQGVDTMYLFTDTAEQLYSKLGWGITEKVVMGPRMVTVMQKQLIV